MTKPRQPPSDEVHRKRMLVWRHNAYMGSVRMAEVFCHNLQTSTTATAAAKATAGQIEELLATLKLQLKERNPLS